MGKTGFAPAEIFRKYVRYKPNEEPFTVDFVADVLALRRACELDGDTAMNVLLETGTRIVKTYQVVRRNCVALARGEVEVVKRLGVVEFRGGG